MCIRDRYKAVYAKVSAVTLNSEHSATDFTPEDYYWTMGKCLDIENCIKEHSAVMDKYDPKKRVALMVDEWGGIRGKYPGRFSARP